MSKSLNELFGLLANAGAPRSAEEYRASLAGIRSKVKNSSACLRSDEKDKAKCIADNLGVDKNGKTPLSKVFSKPKITNCGNSADHPKVTNIQGGWNYDPSTSTYSSKVSTLNQSNKQDPWGRPLLMRYLKQNGDGEDTSDWSGTIQAPPASMGTLGKAAKIKIFND
jgi:hypothetical protein